MLPFALVVLLAAAIPVFAQAPSPAPGLSIPSGDRPWALDQFQGKPQLVPVRSSAVQLNNHRGGNLAGGLLAGPLYKAKATTEIGGTSAATVLHSTTPAFYVHFDDSTDSGQSMIAGWAVVHTIAAKDRRLLSTVKYSQLTGTSKRNDTQVEVEIEHLPDHWLKITPKASLAAGEYALLPVMRQDNAFSTMAYDFRLDPAAANDEHAVTQ